MKPVKTGTVQPVPSTAKESVWRSVLYSKKAAPYLFTAPFVISFLIFFLYPIISVFIMSFQRILPGRFRLSDFPTTPHFLIRHSIQLF